MMSEQSTIPLIYRITFNFIEPIFAIGGVLQLHFSPSTYLSIANPNALSHYTPAIQTLMTQIAGGWLILALNDLVTLRLYADDVKLWRCIIAIHLVSDVVYCYALVQDLGLLRFVNPVLWTSEDWLTMGTTLPPLILKVAFLLGMGLNSGKSSKQKK